MHIEVDTHTHTIASGHAYSTLAENIAAASLRGIKLLAVTEHGPAMPGAPHIWYFQNMRVIPHFIQGVCVLRGIEANIINTRGEIDIEEQVLAGLDIVLASLHEPVIVPATRRIHTDTVVKAMASGKIDVFAHGGNPQFPIFAEEIAQAASSYNVLIEINNSSFTTSRPGSSENCATLIQAVAKHSGKLTFGSDAHIADRVGCFTQCCALVKEIGFPAKDIVSTNAVSTLHFLRGRNRPYLDQLLDHFQ